MTIFDYNYRIHFVLNLSIPLKDSGSCSKMTSSCNCPVPTPNLWNPPLTLPRERYHPGVASRNPLISAFVKTELSHMRDVYLSTLTGINSLKHIKWNVLAVTRKTRTCHWNVQNVAQRFACLTPHPLQRVKTTTDRSLTSVRKKF